MKVYSPTFFLFFLCQIFTCTTHAQRIDFGIGFHSNHGQLILDNQALVIDEFRLSNKIANSVGGNVFVEFTNKNSLTLRTNLIVKQKQVKIQILEDLDATRRNRELLKYNFFSTELEFNASYRFDFSKDRWSIYPSLGFSIGTNELNTISYSQKTNYMPPELRNRDLPNTIGLNIGNRLFHTTIIGGVRIHPPLFIFKRQIEFQASYHLVPSNYLEEPLNLPPFSVEGPYHSFSFGVNFYLRKSPIKTKK